MPSVRSLQYSFGGGEVTPEFFGRVDDNSYRTGVEIARNMVTLPHGPAVNRPGTRFVRATKGNKAARLIPFTFASDQTLVIEMVEGYFRFHTLGATVLDGATPYEVAHPYQADELFDVHFVQSADVMTLTHPNHRPRELRRNGATDWSLVEINFGPVLSPPKGFTATEYHPSSASVSADTKQHLRYVVTAVDDEGRESLPSIPVMAYANIFVTGAMVTLDWFAVAGANRYRVYKKQSGAYGLIGETQGLTLDDDNIEPDAAYSIPVYDYSFMPGGIESVEVTDGGSGYGSPQLYYKGIIAALVDAGGSGYTDAYPPTVTASGGDVIDAATFRAVVENGVVVDVVVTYGGVYRVVDDADLPTLTITDDDPSSAGTGAGATATVYENNDTLGLKPIFRVDDPTGIGAEIEPVVQGGRITAINVVSPGYGYTDPSIVTIETAGGHPDGATSGTQATFGDITLTGEDYPGAVAYFEQRRVFAGTTAKPQNLWTTRTGTESAMSYSLPLRDDDRIAFRIAAREVNRIQHIIPLLDMVLLTSSTEYQVRAINSDALTPTSISVKPQSYVGASNVQPILVNNNVLYVSARGNHVRELGYSFERNGYQTGDVSIRAPHLFDGQTVVDMTFSKAPYPIAWFCNDRGELRSLTYIPEQNVGAWHRHDTDGEFESICAVPEGDEDVIYCVVKREIDGQTVRYIERMAEWFADGPDVDLADAMYLDCGLSYDGTPETTFTGLDHLEGETVGILADGAVLPQQVVTDGSITIATAASKVHVGLPITAELQTLPLAAQIDGALGLGRAKNINKAMLRVHRATGIFAGPPDKTLYEAKLRRNEPPGTPPSLKTEDVEVRVAADWNYDAALLVRQSDPLPVTLVRLTLEVALGG